MRRTQGPALLDDSYVSWEARSIAIDGLPAQAPATLDLAVDCWRYRCVKRAIDLIGAFLMLVVFLIPGLLIALLIRLTSPHPIFYREVRIGLNGVPFRILKFRTMRPPRAQTRNSSAHSEQTVLQWRMEKHPYDPRITTLGRFLRRWSLDELPQVFNVLRGEMSLIGPRPIVKAETYFYDELLTHYLAAKPGLSGLWQVSGRSNLDYKDRARLDADYVEGWSLRTDLRIFIRTIPAVLSRVGAR